MVTDDVSSRLISVVSWKTQSRALFSSIIVEFHKRLSNSSKRVVWKTSLDISDRYVRNPGFEIRDGQDESVAAGWERVEKGYQRNFREHVRGKESEGREEVLREGSIHPYGGGKGWHYWKEKKRKRKAFLIWSSSVCLRLCVDRVEERFFGGDLLSASSRIDSAAIAKDSVPRGV